MGTNPRILFITLLGISGCVSHSIREDTDAVRATLRERAELELVDREPEAFARTEPMVRELLSEPIDAERAVRLALLNNRSLRAELYELGIARGELVQAGLLPNPTIHGEVRFPEDQMQPAQWDFGFAFDLTSMILAPIRAHAASARLDAARFRTAGAVLDLAYRTRLAFYRYQASAQQLELLRTSMESFRAAVTAARALRDAGNVRDLDVAIEEAAFEESRIEVTRAELEMLDDLERLNVLLGLHGRDVSFEIAGRMPDPPADSLEFEALESRAIESSLELAWTRAELEAIARSIGSVRAEALIPDIEVGFHAEYDETRWEYGPEITIGIPVFSQGQGTILSREAELEGLRERYIGYAIAVRASVRAARNRAVTSELLARRYREVLLPARVRVFEETLLLYNAMQLDVFRLLQSRREQLDAASQYIESLREYWEARATLEQVLSGRLAGTITSADPELGERQGMTGRSRTSAESVH